MRVVIAGSSTIEDYNALLEAINDSEFEITQVVCGCARGVDAMGDLWAHANNIPVVYFKPDWNTYGRSAGPRRNAQMAENADALIAVWDGKSPGTKNMIEQAQRRHLHIHIHLIK